jgi:tape measure domain-containing protein
MALSIGSIATTFVAKTKPFESGVKRASASVKKMGNDVRTAGQRAADGFRKFSNSVIVQAAKIGVAIAAIGFVKMGIGAAATMQQDLITIKTFVGSAEKARDVMESLREFAKKTPFQLTDLVEATKKMLAFGFAQDEIIPKMKIFGNLASAANVPVAELVQIFGKIKSQGKLMGETLNQLAERGIPVISALADHFKVPEAAIREMVTAGKVSFDDMMSAMDNLAGAGGQMGNLMEEQAETLAGRWSTLKDKFEDLALTIGDSLIPALERLVDMGSDVVDWVKNMDAETVRWNLTLVGMGATFLMILKWFPKIIRGFKLVINTLKGFAAASATANAFAMNFPGLIAATAAASAAGVFIYKTMGDMEAQAEETARAMDELVNSSRELERDKIVPVEEDSIIPIEKAIEKVKELNTELGKTSKPITVAVKGTAAEFSARQRAAGALEKFQKAQLKAAENALKQLQAIKKNTEQPLAAAGI